MVGMTFEGNYKGIIGRTIILVIKNVLESSMRMNRRKSKVVVLNDYIQCGIEKICLTIV